MTASPIAHAVMRLLHVVPTYIPAWRYGGPIHSVHGLCKALARRGHAVTVATTNVDGPGDSDVPFDRAVSIDGVQVRYFESRVGRRLYYSRTMNRYLREAIGGFDVVHTHAVFLWPPWAAGAIARERGIPHVMSPRGMLVEDLIARRSPLVKRAWIRLVERRRLADASAVHVTSPVEAAELQRLHLLARRTFVVPNGVDMPSADDPQAVPPRLPAGYVLFMGRLNWKKGLERLVDAIALVPRAHLAIAGMDEEDGWTTLRARAAAAGAADRVTYVGPVMGPEKRSLLGAASMLVLPSYSENFGNVVLEAMAYGVPAIVTPQVGAAELVRGSNAGMVVDGNPESLAAAIGTLLGDPARAAALGDNARRAASALSWDAIAQSMEACYAELLAERAAAASNG